MKTLLLVVFLCGISLAQSTPGQPVPSNYGSAISGPANSLVVSQGPFGNSYLPSPTTNGFYQIGFNVTGGVAVNPSANLGGIPFNPNSEGTCATASIAANNRGSLVYCSGGTTSTVLLPVATGNTASNFPFVLCNFNSGQMTLTPQAPNNIDGQSSQASDTIFVNDCAFIYQDAGSPINWWTIQVPGKTTTYPITQQLNAAMTAQSTATPTSITNMTWTLVATTIYWLECDIPVTFTASATIAFVLSGSGNPASVMLADSGNIGAAGAFQLNSFTALASTWATTQTATSGAPGAGTFLIHVTATIGSGASGAGAMSLQTIANGTNTIQVRAGASCRLTRMN